MTIADFLCFLYEQVRRAIEQKDDDRLDDISTTLNLLIEAVGKTGQTPSTIIALADNLDDNIRDYFHHVEWKSTWYSDEQIRHMIETGVIP